MPHDPSCGHVRSCALDATDDNREARCCSRQLRPSLLPVRVRWPSRCRPRRPYSALVRSGVIVLDLSSSTDSAPPRDIPGLLRHLANAGGRYGSRPLLRRRVRGASARDQLGGAAPLPALLPAPAGPGRPRERCHTPAGTAVDAMVEVVPVGDEDLRRARGRAEDGARGTVGGHTTWFSSAISTIPCSISTRS